MGRMVVLALAAVLLAAAGRGGAAERIAVDGPAALAAALAAARGGEVLALAPGAYGPLVLTRAYDPPVTLASDPGRPARFERVEFGTDVGGVRFEGLVVEGPFHAIRGSRGIAMHRVRLRAGMLTRRMAGLRIEDSEISGGQYGLALDDATDVVLRRTTIRDAGEDLLRITGRSEDVLVEDCRLLDVAADPPAHPDLVMVFAYGGHTPRRIVFRGNLLHDDPATGTVEAQGLFVATGPFATEGFRDILMEENLVNVGSPNSIYIDGGIEAVVIRNNSLIPWPNGTGAMIRLSDKADFPNTGVTVTGNVASRLLDQSRDSILGTNFFYDRVVPAVRLFSGPGGEWRDYLPLKGSQIDFGSPFGAQARLRALLAGAP